VAHDQTDVSPLVLWYTQHMKSMNYSKAHQNFSNRLQEPEALTNPQDFLGPNYEAVINFWWYMDSLTKDQWKEVARRYRALDPAAEYAAWPAAKYAACYAARSAAWDATWDVAWSAAGNVAWDARYAAGYATYELIGMHTLLNEGKDLLFVPLFNDL
jgi:hypothetical protein